MEIFTDADWAGAHGDRRCMSEYCTYVWGNLVTWRSKKQNVVARSIAEAEFKAVAHGICKVIWVKRILEELKMKIEFPMSLYTDSKAAIDISHNPVQHHRTKHVEVDKHFIKEKIEGGLIALTHMPTRDQTADIFTKGLYKEVFEKFVDKLDMVNIYSPT